MGNITGKSHKEGRAGLVALWRVVGEDERMTPAHYAAMRSDGLSFLACLEATAGTMELVREFDRLYGASLAKRRAPIEAMIDAATGKQDADMQGFLRFVWNCVFLRTPAIPPSFPNIRDMGRAESAPTQALNPTE